eukprot:524418-Pleurochrysis_carterae.AAC.1
MVLVINFIPETYAFARPRSDVPCTLTRRGATSSAGCRPRTSTSPAAAATRATYKLASSSVFNW